MPTALLTVPYYEQSRDGTCLPACVRMVTAYWGDQYSENELVKQLGTKRFGTPITNAKRLQSLGYKITIGELTRKELETFLASGQPVIVRVWTAMLDYWDVATSHVIVINGFDEKLVYMNDPAFPEETQRVLWDSFLAAWAEYDETAVILSKENN